MGCPVQFLASRKARSLPTAGFLLSALWDLVPVAPYLFELLVDAAEVAGQLLFQLVEEQLREEVHSDEHHACAGEVVQILPRLHAESVAATRPASVILASGLLPTCLSLEAGRRLRQSRTGYLPHSGPIRSGESAKQLRAFPRWAGQY